MKNLLKHLVALFLLTLVFGLTAFSPDNSELPNEEVSSCYVYSAELTAVKWSEIASPHGYTQYIVIDLGSIGIPDHIIGKADYNGDWAAFMNCIGLPSSTESIIIADDLGGT